MAEKKKGNGFTSFDDEGLPEENALLPTVVIEENVPLPDLENEVDNAPRDKYWVVYVIFLIHGIGTLMPWNMFITANDYFTKYKLGENYTANGTNAEVYRVYFLSFLGFTAQIPNVILNFINVFLQCGGRGNLSRRITYSIIVVVVMFIITVLLAMVDSSTWPAEFFWITMLSVVIINMANGMYQNSVYGAAACLPMAYTNSVVLGSNLSGTLTALLNLASIALSPDPRTAAIYYFIAAILILLVAFDTYFVLPFMPFYRHYQNRASIQQENNDANNPGRPPYWDIFVKCYKQHLGVWFVFFVTLTCFPAIQAGVEPLSPFFTDQKRSKYFTAVTTFLLFNLFAVCGNLTSAVFRWPGPKWVWIPIALRVLFIPYFVLCNFSPQNRDIPVVIASDWAYCLGAIAMAYSSGYYSSLTMMYAPGCVSAQHQGTAGMMAAFFLIFGIMCGVLFSFPVTYLVTMGKSSSAVTTAAVTAADWFNSTTISVTLG